VSAKTHKELDLEILITMAPILDEGVSSLSFRLEGNEQYIRELLGFQKGAREQVDVHGDALERFWGIIEGEDNMKGAWSMKLFFHQVFVDPPTDSERVSYACFTPTLQSVQKISDCAVPNVFAISPCTGLQIYRFWRHWNRHLMELLIFNFILLLHI
jgi:hypothetical protein